MEKKIAIGELVGLGVLVVLSIWSFITTKSRNNKRLAIIEDKLGLPHEVKKEKSKKDKDAKEDEKAAA